MEREARRSDVNIMLIVTSTLIGVLILVLILAWLRSWFFAGRNEALQKYVLSVENPALLELSAREKEELTTYGWVDREKGVVRIPVERAMTILAEEAGDSRPESEEP